MFYSGVFITYAVYYQVVIKCFGEKKISSGFLLPPQQSCLWIGSLIYIDIDIYISLSISISISIFFNKDSYNNYFLKLSGAGRGSPGTSTGIRETKNRKQTNHVQ